MNLIGIAEQDTQAHLQAQAHLILLQVVQAQNCIAQVRQAQAN